MRCGVRFLPQSRHRDFRYQRCTMKALMALMHRGYPIEVLEVLLHGIVTQEYCGPSALVTTRFWNVLIEL